MFDDEQLKGNISQPYLSTTLQQSTTEYNKANDIETGHFERRDGSDPIKIFNQKESAYNPPPKLSNCNFSQLINDTTSDNILIRSHYKSQLGEGLSQASNRSASPSAKPDMVYQIQTLIAGQ